MNWDMAVGWINQKNLDATETFTMVLEAGDFPMESNTLL
jgi:hypothetical protein